MSAKLSLGFAVGFWVILAALHVLEPEFNPPHLISEYELGRFGWLMSIAFFSMGAASLALARALWSGLPRRIGRRTPWWLALIGIAYFSAGIFRTQRAPSDQMARIENVLHGISGMIVIFSSPVVIALLSIGLGTAHWSSNAARIIKWLAIATWLSTFAFLASGFAGVTNAVIGGWVNRFMITTYCAWLIAVALSVVKTGPLMKETQV